MMVGCGSRASLATGQKFVWSCQSSPGFKTTGLPSAPDVSARLSEACCLTHNWQSTSHHPLWPFDGSSAVRNSLSQFLYPWRHRSEQPTISLHRLVTRPISRNGHTCHFPTTEEDSRQILIQISFYSTEWLGLTPGSVRQL